MGGDKLVSNSGRGVPADRKYVFLASLTASLFAFLSAPLLARLLGPDLRGEVAAVVSTFFLLRFAGNFGASETATAAQGWEGYTFRFILRSTIFWAVIVNIFLITAAWYGAPVLFPGEDSVASTLRLCLPILVLAIASDILRAALLGRKRFVPVALHIVSLPVVRFTGVVVLITFAITDVTTAVLVCIGGVVVAFLVVLFHCVRTIRAENSLAGGSGSQTKMSYSEVFKFSARVGPGTLARVANRRVDQIILFSLAGGPEAGIYAVSVALAEVPDLFTRVFRQMTLADQSSDQSNSRLFASVRTAMSVFLLVALPLAVAMPLVLPHLFGVDFKAAVIPAMILLAAGFFNVIREVFGVYYLSTGRPGTESIFHLSGNLVSIVALLVLAPAFGAVGAALAALLTYFTVAFLVVYMFFRENSDNRVSELIPTMKDIREFRELFKSRKVQ